MANPSNSERTSGVRYRDKLGTRALAWVVLVPAFIFLGLAVDGDGWWWGLAAVAYPLLAAGVLFLFVPNTGSHDDQER